MCGIAGMYVGPRNQVSSATLLAMAGELEHRGPDGVGLYLDRRFGMVATRLAIIDLERGDPPLRNEDGRYWVIQNGEIYNHVELREELAGHGHSFATQSADTEVLVHAYEQWGEGMLDHLNGDFAFCIWDRETEEAFLARDRFGVRPLFVFDHHEYTAFASEPGALLRLPEAPRQLDATALVETFTTWSSQGHRTPFTGIRELPPAHFMRLGSDGPTMPTRWWSLDFGPRLGRRREPMAALSEELFDLLDDATRIRLRADVPVGVYLSGGLDSSATTALARRHAAHPLEAFAVGFEESRFDETPFQQVMAKAADVHLNHLEIGDLDIAQAFPEVVARAAMPMLRTSPAPLYRLAQHVRDHGFKVVVTGEGADELLGGYGVFQETMVRRFWARQPSSTLRPQLLRRIYPYLSQDLGKGGGFVGAFFGQRLEETDDPLYGHRPRFATSAQNLRFLHPDVRAEAASEVHGAERIAADLSDNFSSFGPLGQVQWTEIETFLTRYLLHAQGDRMLMAHGVEGRFPFLDVRVAEFAASLPERARLADLQEKPLLRRAVGHLLPSEITARRKLPYRAPILRPFFGPSAPAWVDELLSEQALSADGLFDAPAVQKLQRKVKARLADGVSERDEMAIVGILSTQWLVQHYVHPTRWVQPPIPSQVIIGDALHDSATALTARGVA